MDRTFLLGVGAQKAGTTWLYQYLRRLPECNMGTIKEYAVFDTLFRPDLFPRRPVNRLRQLSKLVETHLEQARSGEGDAPPVQPLLDAMDSVALGLDLDRYVPHFDRLAAARPGIRMVGDITPEYSALDAAHFQRIREMLDSGGYRVKVVFLMRDPLERCYSAIRMSDRNRRTETGTAKTRPAHARFEREAQARWCEVRSRYDRTIPALEAAFPPESLFYGFYETLFSEERIRELTDFLGVSFRPPDFGHRANASPREDEPDAAALDRVRAFYEPTYAFCRERFGQAFIDGIWRHAARG
ncbi:Sulfotransferase family protein [Tranquillimonas rosea]|uniref:Sulfotransferase family protein n=1 Tax=Tranquillimonas rosea TaxID=641238 RepID=A0A1H9WZF7_9RHOB|nr:sulfotransferase [Tranquillimonas rosea]SES39181.1 Sulfotransferase family protein [Tranquillimonas rosea]